MSNKQKLTDYQKFQRHIEKYDLKLILMFELYTTNTFSMKQNLQRIEKTN